nr:alpha/beta fold hydrolase [Beutenbergia cavernae]
MLLVHGIRTSSTMWRHQLEVLRALGFRAEALDLPGHGARRGETFTLDAARESIESARSGMAEDAVVVGLSLGGYLALDWAARTTHPATRLVVSSCTALPGGWGHRAYLGLSDVIGRLPADGATRLSDAAARGLVGRRAAEDVAAGGVAVEAQLATLRALLAVRPLDDLARIDVPVTFLLGGWDHFRTEQSAFERAARRGDVVVVPRATHLVSLHRPLAYDRALLGILDRDR